MTNNTTRDTIPAPPLTSTIDSTTSLIGTMIDGRYRLDALLGEGGMGAVYRAHHIKMGKDFALKLIHQELSHVKEIAKRFEREARSSSKLTDPHCIAVTDFGKTDTDNLYLVMELLEGEELATRLERDGGLPIADAVDIVKQILLALTHAHEKGIVHRDLKPENVFLITLGDRHNYVKILDFGIAKMASDAGGEKLTRTGIVYGTPRYLAPEQALGDVTDHRTDIYSVGIILYEALTGQPPYSGSNAMDTMSKHLTASVPRIANHGKFPRMLQRIINQAMAKRPEDRFQSAKEFLQTLEGVDPDATGEISVADLLPDVLRFKEKGRDTDPDTPETKKRRLRLLALGLVCLVVGAGWLLLAHPSASDTSLDTPPIQEAPPPDDPPLVTKDEQLQEMLDATQKLIDDKDIAASEKSARETLMAFPEAPDAMLMLGHALFISDKRIGALFQYQKAIDANDALRHKEQLLDNLIEGLKWSEIRKKSATMLAQIGRDEDIDKLIGFANSPLIDGDVRRASREALVKTDRADLVDWVESLTADFHEASTCKQRKQIISQMANTTEKRFIAFLKEQATKTRNLKMRRCIAPAVKAAVKTLKTPSSNSGDPPSDT